ncbi:hypothetical protein L1887_40221 [Cichorium endivia]|nr:hypothetical protein L1887_40221 [Cichorium endivia]
MSFPNLILKIEQSSSLIISSIKIQPDLVSAVRPAARQLRLSSLLSLQVYRISICLMDYWICNHYNVGLLLSDTEMHPPLTLHRHPMCAEIIEQFQKCHIDHPYAKFFGECTDLKIKLDKCFRQEKAVKRKANFEESKKLKERLQAYRKEAAGS